MAKRETAMIQDALCDVLLVGDCHTRRDWENVIGRAEQKIATAKRHVARMEKVVELFRERLRDCRCKGGLL
jgi:hypothetical protein